MFSVRYVAIGCFVIVLLILFFSNLVPVTPLVFLGKRTIPIPLGLLFIGAFSAGLATSMLLRALMAAQRPRQQRQDEPAEFYYADQSSSPSRPIDDWKTARPETDYSNSYVSAPERFMDGTEHERPAYARDVRAPEEIAVDNASPASDYVYDADYRVISQPQPASPQPPPAVNSKLPPDSEDWGFDFDDEDKPRK